jgi:hypothetical protein
MFVLILLLALLFPVSAFAESVNYTELLERWSHTIHPQEPFAAKVITVKPVLGAGASTGILMFQVHYTYKWGVESIILILKGSHVLGWVFAGTAEEEEPEEEPQEIFSHKDAA